MVKELKSGKYKFHSVKYPEYEQKYDDDLLYKKYAERLNRIKETNDHAKYPLNKEFFLMPYPLFELKNTIFLNITPSRFLQLAFPKAHINISSIDYLFDAFEFGNPKLKPLYLNLDESLNVMQHEGRHRADISKDLGINFIPIMIKISFGYTNLSYKEITEFHNRVKTDGFSFELFEEYQEKITHITTRDGRIIGKYILLNLIKPEKNLNLDRRGLIETNREKRRKYGIGKLLSLFSLKKRPKHSNIVERLKTIEGVKEVFWNFKTNSFTIFYSETYSKEKIQIQVIEELGEIFHNLNRIDFYSI